MTHAWLLLFNWLFSGNLRSERTEYLRFDVRLDPYISDTPLALGGGRIASEKTFTRPISRRRGYIGIPKEHGEHVSQFKTHSMVEAFILKENKYLCPP